MNLLKTLAALFSLLCIGSAATGIQAIAIKPPGATVAHFDTLGRFWALGLAVVLALFAYGIHIRFKFTWRAGFVLLGLNYAYSTVGAVAATYRAAKVIDVPTFWLPAGLIVVAFTGVCAFWALWWTRQRTYFFSPNAPPSLR